MANRDPRSEAGGRAGGSAFERRFRTAALRVLRRRGVPKERLEEEVERLRRLKLPVELPTVEALERALGEIAAPR